MSRLAGAFTAIAVVLVMAAPAAANAAPTRARVTAIVEPNGIVDVTEERFIRSVAPYTATVDVLMSQGELFAEPAVVVGGRSFHAGDGRAADTFLVSKGTKGIRIAWRQPRGTHSAILRYRLALRATAYRDVVDLRLVLWNAGDALRRLDATVVLPRAPRNSVHVWLDPRPKIATAAAAGKRIYVQARDLSEHESLALRVAFPRDVLASTSGTIVRPRAGLELIAAEESHAHRHTNWIVVAAGIAFATALGFFAVLYRSRRRRRNS